MEKALFEAWEQQIAEMEVLERRSHPLVLIQEKYSLKHTAQNKRHWSESNITLANKKSRLNKIEFVPFSF